MDSEGGEREEAIECEYYLVLIIFCIHCDLKLGFHNASRAHRCRPPKVAIDLVGDRVVELPSVPRRILRLTCPRRRKSPLLRHLV